MMNPKVLEAKLKHFIMIDKRSDTIINEQYGKLASINNLEQDKKDPRINFVPTNHSNTANNLNNLLNN